MQTVLSLPNGQMHLVIFTSNSYNDEKAGGGWVRVVEEGVFPDVIHSSVISLSFCSYI